MKHLSTLERVCLYGHLIAMAFGLAGLLWVVPHPGILDYLPAGQTMFRWSMAGGGVSYILLGTIAMALYGYRTLGLKAVLAFAAAAIGVSLSSELLGTSTGFPFGHYSYLSGLGYKIGGLVPFTIPLSWFYLGLASYLLARSGLKATGSQASQVESSRGWLRTIGAIFLGSVLLTSWDFVLDPAMSQTALPFWYWHEPGAFFGMPYQNFAGWLGTGVVFMSVGLGLWRTFGLVSEPPKSVTVPLIVYVANFTFALVMSLAAGFYVPIAMGMITGLIPAILCWRTANQQEDDAMASGQAIDASVVSPANVALK